jgi:shikimate 5-dehydrogenase
LAPDFTADTTLITYGMGRYGLSASQCIRKDVSLNFIQAAAEVAQYAKDGLDIMLDQGRENSKLYLKDNPDTALEIENLIRGKYNLKLIKSVVNEKNINDDI